MLLDTGCSEARELDRSGTTRLLRIGGNRMVAARSRRRLLLALLFRLLAMRVLFDAGIGTLFNVAA